MIGLSLCGDSRLASIHLRDEGEPVPVTQAAAGPHKPPAQNRTGQDKGFGLGSARLARARPMCPVCLCGACVSQPSVGARGQISMGQLGRGPRRIGKSSGANPMRLHSHEEDHLDGWLCLTCRIPHPRKRRPSATTRTNRQQEKHLMAVSHHRISSLELFRRRC